MKKFERVQNVIKRDHKQMWLLLSTHPSPLQDVVSVEGAMTGATIYSSGGSSGWKKKQTAPHTDGAECAW